MPVLKRSRDRLIVETPEAVSLREYIDLLIDQLDKRLDRLEEIANTVQEAQYNVVPKEYYDSRHEAVVKRLEAIENKVDINKAEISERRRISRSMLAFAVGIGGLTSVIGDLIFHFVKVT